MPSIPVRPLGQSGFRFTFDDVIVYVDPYLSDSVQRLEGPQMARLVAAPLEPERIDDAAYILTTHSHRDHCDPDTILPIAASSPAARVIAPPPAAEVLLAAGLAADRIVPAAEEWLHLATDLAVIAVPAAHPAIERDSRDALLHVGYVFEHRGRRIYHSGDTSLTADLIAALSALTPIDAAFLPVNERNFLREQRGIIANMSVREAFHFAEVLGARALVPMHWDLFAPNSVFREEIELLYRLLAPKFELVVEPREI